MTQMKLCALVATLATVFALAGCGEDEQPANQTRTAANGEEFNDSDVAFATDMTVHHAQALTMVDQTVGRDLDPEVLELAEQIRSTQGPEIERFTDLLTAWDAPVPETMRDHANAHGGGEMDMGDMPGMMTGEEMSELENASAAQFESLFLELMIEHHEGAIEMAQTEQAEGASEPAIELAESIETGQQQEVERMEDLLGS